MTGLVVVLVLVVAAIVVTPEAPPAFEGGARAARQGMPHLGLYLVAALVLAVTTQAPRASGSVDAEKRETRWLAFWLAAALVVAAVNTVRLDGDMTARGASFSGSSRSRSSWSQPLLRADAADLTETGSAPCGRDGRR